MFDIYKQNIRNSTSQIYFNLNYYAHNVDLTFTQNLLYDITLDPFKSNFNFLSRLSIPRFVKPWQRVLNFGKVFIWK
jgi:hypothetical protein